MTVYDRWHKSRPKKDERKCSEHRKVPTSDHGIGERWQVRYRDRNGDQRKQNFARLADADRFDANRKADESRGEWIDPRLGQTHFGDYAPTWMSARLHKPSTVERYAIVVNNHINPTFGKVGVGSIRPTAVQAWVKGLQVQGLAPRTIGTIYTIFASIMRGAVRDELIRKTPCVDIRLPYVSKTTIRLLSTDQVAALYRAMLPEYRALVLVGAGSGLRQGEAFGLARDRVDFVEGMITVDQQVVVIKSRPMLGTPKSPASVREVPMPAFVAAALKEHVALYDPLDVVFRTALRHNLIRRDYFNANIWKPAVKAAGLMSDTTFHDLRHTFASTALASGVPISEVSRWLGHESITTTVDLYGHLVPEASSRAREALDKAFGSALSVP
ncbi:tyrosine-type recombinase/integrase [Nonomuraea endophytica]|uniref:tyrosine-type recombinase/integrase n=1 Tax=Nonomuraea endophytica TaxID=714136 RepID=UPI0037CBFF74